MTNNTLSRRKFLTSGAIAVTGFSALGFTSLGLASFKNDMVRVGIIGTGSRGAGLASLIKEIQGMELVACCDIIPEHLQNGMNLAAKGAKAYTDYRKLLEDNKIDAVIIAVPLYLHYPIAVDALDAGKHVYLEKSMTYDIPQAIDLVKKVRNSKLVFQVGFQYRYYALIHRVKEFLSENWLGKITHFECQYNRNSDWKFPVKDPKLELAINWRMYRKYCGGPLSELCAHQIDVVNFLLESHPVKVCGSGGINYWKDERDTYDHIRTIYEYPGGIQSSVTSLLSNAYNGYNIRILGDEATLEIQTEHAFIYREPVEPLKGTVDGVTSATKALGTDGKGIELIFHKEGEKMLEASTYSLLDFIECIHLKKKPVSNVESGRDTSIAVHMGNAAADSETSQVWQPAYSI
ncbi:MAG: Gfo/Idh/MocA family oxidoreductase [Ferruginibacter sp.]